MAALMESEVKIYKPDMGPLNLLTLHVYAS